MGDPTESTNHAPQREVGRVPEEARCLGTRYLLLGLLGTGGMGSVYRARDLWLDETIAVKTLAGVPLVALGREVRLARRITHPNVVRVFDMGTDGELCFISMEYVDGGSLRTVDGRLLTPADVAEIGTQVCAGLGAAHAAGIVHRDLKPANVLVSEAGVVKLTDFGIATALTDEPLGENVGTPAYMAPEQLEGELPDARTDVYGVGRVLLDLLAVEEIRRPRDSDVRALLGDTPDALAAVVLRCLATRRDDRFSTVAAVAAALAAAVGTRTTSVPSNRRQARRVFVHEPPPTESEAATRAAGVVQAMADVLRHADGMEIVWGDARDAISAPVDADLFVKIEPREDAPGDRERVDVEARLVGRRDALVLWQRASTLPIEETLVWGRETAHAIARMLEGRLRSIAREPLTDPKALDLYLRARVAYTKRWPGALHAAIDLLEQARKVSPADPLVIASLAVVNALLLMVTDDAEALDRTESLARRAATLAPDRAEGHLAIGCVLAARGEEAAAVARFVTCLELAPSLAEAHAQLGLVLAESGPVDVAFRHLDAAQRLDRAFATLGWAEGRVAYVLQRADWTKRFDTRPTDPALLNFFWLNRLRVALYADDARLSEAELAAFAASVPFDLKVPLGVFVALSRKQPVAREHLGIADSILARCDERLKRRRAFGAIMSTEIAACAGEWDLAAAAFERAANEGARDVVWAERCPLVLQLRRERSVQNAYERIVASAAEVRDALGTTR